MSTRFAQNKRELNLAQKNLKLTCSTMNYLSDNKQNTNRNNERDVKQTGAHLSTWGSELSGT